MDIGRIAHGGVYIYRGELDFMARTILDSPHMEPAVICLAIGRRAEMP